MRDLTEAKDKRLEYGMVLTVQDQRMALMDVAKALQKLLNSLKRKRSWKESERAMTSYTYEKQLIAVNMAIDRLDTDKAHAEWQSPDKVVGEGRAGAYENEYD